MPGGVMEVWACLGQAALHPRQESTAMTNPQHPAPVEETDRWVQRVTTLAREIDDTAASLHPSAWREVLGPQLLQYRKLAGQGRYEVVK